MHPLQGLVWAAAISSSPSRPAGENGGSSTSLPWRSLSSYKSTVEKDSMEFNTCYAGYYVKVWDCVVISLIGCCVWGEGGLCIIFGILASIIKQKWDLKFCIIVELYLHTHEF
jgi:hypothetical protein